MEEKKRKPLWLKLLISLLSSVLSLALLFGGFCVFAKVKYGINVFETFSQLSQISKEINAEDKFLNMFSVDDMSSAQTTVNHSIPNLITYSETDGYSISSEISGTMSEDICLTSKQVGAVLNLILESQENSGITIAGKSFSLNLIQIAFSDIKENSVEFNAVVKIDISSIKESMNFFPANWIAKHIPSNLYLSSTVIINKAETPFTYNVQSKGLTVNNLDEKGTASFFKTINTFISFGSLEDINNSIGGTFANAMIGNEENTGFAYSLKDVGATDFTFQNIDETNMFIIQK